MLKSYCVGFLTGGYTAVLYLTVDLFTLAAALYFGAHAYTALQTANGEAQA